MHKQTRGSLRLRQWMDRGKVKQSDLAKQVGTHQTNVSAWLQGRPISLKHALAIQKITKIRPEDWTVAEDSTVDLAAAKAS